MANTTIVVPKSTKSNTLEQAVVEKQPSEAVSQEEVVKSEKPSNLLDKSKLNYQFFDPVGVLPPQFQGDIPAIKKVFYVPYKLMFGINEEHFNNLSKANNNYVYAMYDTICQVPTEDYKTVKEFTNYLFDHNKEVVIQMEDLFLHKIHKEIITDLVKETLHKFNLVYSRISIEPIKTNGLKGNSFAATGDSSYVNFIPVHTADGKSVNFIGYSISLS